ncbi:hypothetical protein [Helicobacter rodentium]|nr:hypothetical protein [Helicobacter rodentium]
MERHCEALAEAIHNLAKSKSNNGILKFEAKFLIIDCYYLINQISQ